MLVELNEQELTAIISMADVTVRQQGIQSAEACLVIAGKMSKALADLRDQVNQEPSTK
jgi:hypothetical protein